MDRDYQFIIADGNFSDGDWSVLIGVFMTIIGDIGIEHGLSFPVYMRAPFGTIGTHLPSLVRGVTAACWFGINTYFGAWPSMGF